MAHTCSLADSILQKALQGQETSLEELRLILSHRSQCLPLVRQVLEEEFPKLLQEKEEAVLLKKLYMALIFITIFEDAWACDYVKRLLLLKETVVEEAFGEDFFSDILPTLILSVGRERAREFREIVDNPATDYTLRSSCLDGLLALYVHGIIERQEIVVCGKNFIVRALEGTLDDLDFLCDVVRICTDIWPEECLEEIKEAYAYNLIDTDFISIEEVIRRHQEGLEKTLRIIRKWYDIETFCKRYFPPKNSPSMDQRKRLSKQFQQWHYDNVQAPADAYLEKTDRNDPCPCFSSLKYKKCCLHKDFPERPPHFIQPDWIAQTTLDETIWGSTDTSHLLREEKERILYPSLILAKDPQRSVEACIGLLNEHSEYPILYYVLYIGHQKLANHRESIKALKDLQEKFPDYLYGKIAYMEYLLSRGEIEKIGSLLSGALTPSQLCPTRKVFY